MMIFDQGQNQDRKIGNPVKGQIRQPYQKPRLVELGDLRSLTLGLSVGAFADSGMGLYEDYPLPPISTQ